MEIDFTILKRIVGILVTGYLIYIVVLSIFPYLIPRKVSSQTKESIVHTADFPMESGDRVALVETPEDAFENRMQLIQGAEYSLDIAYHTIGGGETAEQFFGEVIRAADRGVRVRVIVDGKMGGMSGSHASMAYALAIHPNIEYRVYNPLTFLTPWKWNALLHDKFLLADDRFLMLGGRNVGDIYFNPAGHDSRLTLDREVLVFNTNYGTHFSEESVLASVRSYMDSLMNSPDSQPAFHVLSGPKRAMGQATSEEIVAKAKALEQSRPELYRLPTMQDYQNRTVPTGGVVLVANPINTGPKEPIAAYQIQQLALEAKESVWIQTPYASANKHLLSTLHTIHDKGVELDMLTNSIGSTPNFPAFSAYYTQRQKFLDTGTVIHEFQERDTYPKGSIHAKTYLFDENLSAVGSLNLDNRSFYLSTETMLIIHSPEFNQIMRDTLTDWKEDSLTLGSDNEYLEDPSVPEKIAPLPKKIIMYIVSVFSRLFEFLI